MFCRSDFFRIESGIVHTAVHELYNPFENHVFILGGNVHWGNPSYFMSLIDILSETCSLIKHEGFTSCTVPRQNDMERISFPLWVYTVLAMLNKKQRDEKGYCEITQYIKKGDLPPLWENIDISLNELILQMEASVTNEILIKIASEYPDIWQTYTHSINDGRKLSYGNIDHIDIRTMHLLVKEYFQQIFLGYRNSRVIPNVTHPFGKEIEYNIYLWKDDSPPVGLLFGATHMPEFGNALLRIGYEPREVIWLDSGFSPLI